MGLEGGISWYFPRDGLMRSTDTILPVGTSPIFKKKTGQGKNIHFVRMTKSFNPTRRHKSWTSWLVPLLKLPQSLPGQKIQTCNNKNVNVSSYLSRIDFADKGLPGLSILSSQGNHWRKIHSTQWGIWEVTQCFRMLFRKITKIHTAVFSCDSSDFLCSPHVCPQSFHGSWG